MYGLLGKSLSHSLSPLIHESFGNKEYRLFETSDLDGFLKAKNFNGINVTIPFKEKIIPYLDHLDEVAKRTASVNTIICKDGVLTGYNTDYSGLNLMLEHYGILIENKHILIVGNGGVSKTVKTLFTDLRAKSVVKICRNVRESDEIPFDEIDKITDCDIIVNTTPVGMSPNNQDEYLFSLARFPGLALVIDLIYNPLNTNLLLEAKSLHIRAINGLFMVVAQAAYAHDLFFGQKLSKEKIEQTYSALNKKLTNLVLIGLPSSGKSMYAKKLYDIFQKEIIDTDLEIVKNQNTEIPEIFEKYGESYFRKLEYAMVESIFKKNNCVISTGGGMVLDDKLMHLLKQNGLVIFLDKKPEAIAKHRIDNRPLIKKRSDIFQLDQKRRHLYEKHADIILKIKRESNYHFKEIEVKINEYFDYKRT